MFGLNDNTGNNYADTTQASASDASSTNPGSSLDSAPPAPVSQPPQGMPSVPSINSLGASPTLDSPSQSPGMPSMDSSSPDNTHTSQPSDNHGPASSSVLPPINSAHDDDLLKLKQEALQSLAPLVDHLEQDPEEKFKTTMMMIQASDNADLIPEADEAANKIPDDKVRAQALLDVVNEINYFTQHATNTPPQ
jgi:hypothetical protein